MKIEIKPNGVTLYGNAVLTGNATFNQDLTIIGNLNINSNGFINNVRIATINDITTLNVSSGATFLNGMFVSGSFLGTGSFSYSSNNNNFSLNSNGLLINSDLTITGSISRFNSNFNINGSVIITGNSTFASNNIYMSGTLGINNNLVVSGNVSMNTLYVSGNTNINSLVSISGGLVITGGITFSSNNIFISGNLGINNNLVVSGSVSMNTLYVSGNTLINSQVRISGGLVITGGITLASNNIFMSGTLEINNNLVVSGNVSMNTLYVSGNTLINSLVSISGGLVITGGITFSSNNIFMSGTLGINNNLVVSGNVSMNTLYISGNTQINSQVRISGGLVITGGITLASSSVYISGNTTLNSSLNVVGDANFNNVLNRNTLTTPIFTNYINLDDTLNSLNLNITYGNNIFVCNPINYSTITNTPNVGIIKTIDFNGNDIVYGGIGGNYVSSNIFDNTSERNPKGPINAITYFNNNNWVVAGGTFPDFITGGGSLNPNLAIYKFSNNVGSKWEGYQSNTIRAEVRSFGKLSQDLLYIGLNGLNNSTPGDGSICLARLNHNNTLSNFDTKLDVVSLTGTSINSIVVSGTSNVYLGGSINATTSLFKFSLNATGTLNEVTFSNMPGGNLNGPINSMARDTLGNFIIGGSFNYQGSKNIVKYNINTSSWEPLGVGIPDSVNTITLDKNNYIYAGTNQGLYKYFSAYNLFSKLVVCDCQSIKFNSNNNQLRYSNDNSLQGFNVNEKTFSFTSGNTIYDGGIKVNRIKFFDSGENFQISATSNFGTIISKSPNLYIEYQ